MLHGRRHGPARRADRVDARDRRDPPVIGADSLGFLSRQGLLDAVGGRTDARCTACFDGVYPTDVPLELDKLAMERR